MWKYKNGLEGNTANLQHLKNCGFKGKIVSAGYRGVGGGERGAGGG
jgi:hypothetical protein